MASKSITEIITDAISKIALEKKCDEHDVTWRHIATELAHQIKNNKDGK